MGVRSGSEVVRRPKPELSRFAPKPSISRPDASRPHQLETPLETKARVSGPCSVSLISVASELRWRLYECVGPSSEPVGGPEIAASPALNGYLRPEVDIERINLTAPPSSFGLNAF